MATRREFIAGAGLGALAGAMGAPPAGRASPGAIELYLHPQGDDANDGDVQRPLRTLVGARDRIRMLKQSTSTLGPVDVLLQSGEYLLTEGLRLDAQDGGDLKAEVTYRAAPGAEARLFGGIVLDPAAARPLSDDGLLARVPEQARSQVVVFDLSLGPVARRSEPPLVFEDSGGMFSLLHGEEKLPVSRWPRDGYATIAEVLDSGLTPPRGGVFRYRGDHPARWREAILNGELWLTGFWRVPFSVQSVKVAAIDTGARTITLAAPMNLGIGSKYTPMVNGTRRGDGREPFFAFNLPEEIGAPGDWCYLHTRQQLLLWPPDDWRLKPLRLTTLSEPIVRLVGARHIRLEGLTFEGGIAGAIHVEGGENISLAALRFKNIGGGAVDISGGRRHAVTACDFAHVGKFAIRMVCGERRTLTSGEGLIENNWIAHIGEEARISPGIWLGGVGGRLRNNLIHDGPNAGIVYQGNDHLIERNEIHHIGLDSGDLGGIYTNGDWAGLGNVVRHNFIHSAPTANGVYIDDGASGHVVDGNVFYHLASGPFIGGGHGNQVTGNLVVACRLGAHLDDRGISRHYGRAAPHLGRLLNQLDLTRPPWSERYKDALSLIVLDNAAPTGNVLAQNVIIASQKPFDISPSVTVGRKEDWVFAEDPGLKNIADFDLSPKSDLRMRSAFQAVARIPFDQIGLYVDRLRRNLPADLAASRRAVRKSRMMFNSQTDIDASNR